MERIAFMAGQYQDSAIRKASFDLKAADPRPSSSVVAVGIASEQVSIQVGQRAVPILQFDVTVFSMNRLFGALPDFHSRAQGAPHRPNIKP
jgi:hypothetical protein